MKKLTSLLIGCSLALAGAALAQQPVAQESPTKKPGAAEEKTHATQPQPGANAAAPQERPAKQTGARKQRGAMKEPGATNQPGAETQMPETGARDVGKHKHGAKSQPTTNVQSAPATETNAAQQQQQEPGGKKGRHGRNANAETGAETASPGANQQMEQGRKGHKGRGEKAASAPASLAPAAATSATGTNPNAAATQGTVGRGGKKVEKHQIQQIKQQHANFRAQPKPDKVVAVTFNQNYRIEAAQQWQGPRYEVFRSYHPEWHDQGWYRSRYTRVELIGGGWYFWNSGYWYPAWGYDPGVAYYAYDGPIYVGHRAVPPDQVIADVQAELQQMGYYEGEVDGLLGPLTRQALRDYQADHGLIVTEVIDEPTLEALELA